MKSAHRIASLIVVAMFVWLPCRAFGSSAGMPWEGPLTRLVQSLTGPVAKGIGIAAIVIAALGMAMSEGGHASKTFLRILFALAITFTASTFGLQFLGFSGGVAL
jgi:type IV secretion system protein VirB2